MPSDEERRIENLLKSLELPFLTALAEAQSEERLRIAAEREARKAAQQNDPKGSAADGGNDSSTGGTNRTSTARSGVDATERLPVEDADPDCIYVWIKADRESLDRYIDALAHVITHNCQAGHLILDSLTGRLIEEMVQEAHLKGWYENQVSVLDSDEYRAYLAWLMGMGDDGDADSPESTA